MVEIPARLGRFRYDLSAFIDRQPEHAPTPKNDDPKVGHQGCERDALAAQISSANATKRPLRIRILAPIDAARAADALMSIRKSANVSTSTARRKVSTRPCCGIVARIAVGVGTAASCCWMSRSARRMRAA